MKEMILNVILILGIILNLCVCYKFGSELKVLKNQQAVLKDDVDDLKKSDRINKQNADFIIRLITDSFERSNEK